jgi:PAS domain S-box-containing protein
MKWSLAKKITGGFWLALFFLVGIGVVSYWSTKRLIATTGQVAHTHEVLAELDDIPFQLQRAETGQQGYILTGDEQYLQPYRMATTEMPKEIADVRQLITDSPTQQQRLTSIETLIAKQFAQLEKTIALRKDEGLAAALQVIQVAHSEGISNEIQQIVRDMENEEWQLLTARTVAAKASARHTMTMIVGGSLSALTLIALANLIIARNLRKRQKAEEALRESEERYRTLFENASDGILISTLDGEVTSVNRAVEVMLSRSRQELIGHHFCEISTPAAAAQEEERRSRAFALERLPSVYETELVHQDGSVVPVEVRASFLRNEAGHLLGMQGLYRDISLRKAFEQQRTEFLAMLTHDIRNPLGAILGCVELLLQQAKERGFSEDQEILGHLHSSAMTVHALATNYLDFSKIEVGYLTLAKKPVALNRILHKVVQQYEIVARSRHLTLTCCLQEGLPFFEGDPLALERIFANLLHNALKFTPKMGWVTISSARRQDEVVAVIADTGPGFTPEECSSLFEKYRRAETTGYHDGAGLGLYIVKELIDAHGGRIEVESAPGSGSCFSVFLPIARNKPSEISRQTNLTPGDFPSTPVHATTLT